MFKPTPRALVVPLLAGCAIACLDGPSPGHAARLDAGQDEWPSIRQPFPLQDLRGPFQAYQVGPSVAHQAVPFGQMRLRSIGPAAASN